MLARYLRHSTRGMVTPECGLRRISSTASCTGEIPSALNFPAFRCSFGVLTSCYSLKLTPHEFSSFQLQLWCVDLDASPSSSHHMKLCGSRTVFVAVLAFVAALLPFFVSPSTPTMIITCHLAVANDDLPLDNLKSIQRDLGSPSKMTFYCLEIICRLK
jgi:hypothetical protein